MLLYVLYVLLSSCVALCYIVVVLCCIIALLCDFRSQSAVKCWCQPLNALISIATQSCYDLITPIIFSMDIKSILLWCESQKRCHCLWSNCSNNNLLFSIFHLSKLLAHHCNLHRSRHDHDHEGDPQEKHHDDRPQEKHHRWNVSDRAGGLRLGRRRRWGGELPHWAQHSSNSTNSSSSSSTLRGRHAPSPKRVWSRSLGADKGLITSSVYEQLHRRHHLLLLLLLWTRHIWFLTLSSVAPVWSGTLQRAEILTRRLDFFNFGHSENNDEDIDD